MRVAILGGTGSFGRALAARLVAVGEDDVIIGSRDAERARETARELGGARVEGATNDDAVRGADLVVLAVKADARARDRRGGRRRRSARRRSSRSPARSSSERASAPSPTPTPAASPSGSRTSSERPSPAGLHSIAAANLDEAPPEEDALICGDDEGAKLLVARAGRQGRRRPRARRRPARERPRAGGHDRGDRQPEPPLQGARGGSGQRRRVIAILPVLGLPEVEAGR